MGFLGVPYGKESACNAGDLALIPGWEDQLEKGTTTHSSMSRKTVWRFPKKLGIKLSWASLVAQLVKNLPAMKETLVQFLVQGGLLEKG